MQIAIYGRTFGRDFTDIAEKFFVQLKNRNIRTIIYEPFLNFLINNTTIDPGKTESFNSYLELKNRCDFVLSIGGDGTILETITHVRDSGIPVLGINSGRLGFLANISREDIGNTIECLISGRYSLERRSMIEITSPKGVFGDFDYALNEFTLQKKEYAMITVQVWLDDQFLNSYWADGLIVSTPTGSTAYSLSVGGPILSFDAPGFIISPIAPHNLTVRPIVIPDSKVITLKVNSRKSEYLISMDYRSAVLPSEQEIKIKKSEFDISFVRLENQNFYSTLRNKLMWGADKRN